MHALGSDRLSHDSVPQPSSVSPRHCAKSSTSLDFLDYYQPFAPFWCSSVVADSDFSSILNAEQRP
jgi:hypothetical protein